VDSGVCAAAGLLGGQVAYLAWRPRPWNPGSPAPGLPKGVGLEVAQVAENGVLTGKVEEGDVLHKLNDQLLVGPEQLRSSCGCTSRR